MNNIIDSVLVNNYRVLIAIKTVEKFEQSVKQSKAANIPELNFQVNAERDNFSDNSLNGKQGFNLENSLGQNYVEDYIAGLTLNWQPDIWLKIKTGKKLLLHYGLRKTKF